MGQIVSTDYKTKVTALEIEICSIVLEIVQDGHNGTFLVVWKQWLKADVFKSDDTVQSVTPHRHVLNSKLKIEHLDQATDRQCQHVFQTTA